MTRPELRDALARLGRDPVTRAQLVAACLSFEESAGAGEPVREEVTGPIVDALHRDVDAVVKQLADGLELEFAYRSKIARDFVLSVPERPDHVWEPQTTKLVLHLARAARNVVVGGAYFGEHAIPLAAAIAPNGGVCHAFEPDTEQAAMLVRNARRNGLSNVRVSTDGLWDEDGARLALAGHDAYASSRPAREGEAAFRGTTLDTYLDHAGVGDVDLIVLDLEGAEHAALKGARRRLELPPGRAPELVFEVHRSYVDWSHGLERTGILRYLSRLGYSAYAVRDFQSNRDLGGRPIELVAPATAYLDGPAHGFNVLATKEPAQVEAEPFVLSPNTSPKLLAHRDPALHHPVGGL